MPPSVRGNAGPSPTAQCQRANGLIEDARERNMGARLLGLRFAPRAMPPELTPHALRKRYGLPRPGGPTAGAALRGGRR
eukprot:5641314-Lingulodinium_polyedra.AAC.1